MGAIERGVVTQRAVVLLLSLLCFKSLPNNRLGGPENTKVCGFCCCTNVFIANDKILINFATSFTLATASSKSKLFYYTNLGKT